MNLGVEDRRVQELVGRGSGRPNGAAGGSKVSPLYRVHCLRAAEPWVAPPSARQPSGLVSGYTMTVPFRAAITPRTFRSLALPGSIQHPHEIEAFRWRRVIRLFFARLF